MATRAENLQAALDAYALKLRTVAENDSPKTTYSVNGESYDWIGYQQFLIDKMKELEMMIQRAGGPFEVRSQGVT